MNKKVLTEKFLFTFNLPNLSKVNNLELNRKIYEQKQNFVFLPTNKYEDIDILFSQDVKWVSDYVVEKLSVYQGKQTYVSDYFVNVQKPEHISFKRNNINLNDIRNSCDYTCLFIVKGEGNLYLEYDNNIRKQQTFVEKIKEKSIAVFNSDIEYYLDRNTTPYERTVLTFLLKKTC
jgi:hypothetical protein